MEERIQVLTFLQEAMKTCWTLPYNISLLVQMFIKLTEQFNTGFLLNTSSKLYSLQCFGNHRLASSGSEFWYDLVLILLARWYYKQYL